MRSVPMGPEGPCFSIIPNGNRQTPLAWSSALTKSGAVRSSQWDDKFCAEHANVDSDRINSERQVRFLIVLFPSTAASILIAAPTPDRSALPDRLLEAPRWLLP